MTEMFRSLGYSHVCDVWPGRLSRARSSKGWAGRLPALYLLACILAVHLHQTLKLRQRVAPSGELAGCIGCCGRGRSLLIAPRTEPYERFYTYGSRLG